MEKLTVCPVCNSKEIRLKYTVPDRHYGVKGEFTLDKCYKCNLVFLNPMFNDEELSKFYPEDSYYSYYTKYDVTEPKFKITHLLYKIATLSLFERKIEKSKGDKVLDIGCGNGWIIYQYRKNGWNVAGVEPSKIAVEIGNKQNLNIYNGTLLDAKYSNESFDLILSNHSFEHIYNPHAILDEINRILKPCGKVILGIPNYSGLASKIAGQYWYYLGAPVHTFNYSTRNIKQLLTAHGFKVVRTRYVSNSFGIIGSLQIYMNRKSGKPSHEGKLINSKMLMFLAGYLAKFLNLLRLGDCIEMKIEKR